MKRALALLVAVGMIALSLFIRSRIDDDGGSSSSDASLTVACIPELDDACDAMRATGVQVIVEDPAQTVARFGAAAPGIDGWLTLDPWPAIADVLAQRTATTPTTGVASAGLKIAMVGERAPALAAVCGGTVGWRCLVDHVDQPWSELGGRAEWGALRVGLPDPSTASGLLLYANAVAGYFGRTDYATNDFDIDFQAWANGLRSTFKDQPFSGFVLQYPAAFSAVGATAAEITAGLGAKPATIVDPAPDGRAVVVMARVGSKNVSDLAKRREVTDALARLGWTDAPVPSNQTGMPAPGVLLALSGL